jgi:hypothetical protein
VILPKADNFFKLSVQLLFLAFLIPNSRKKNAEAPQWASAFYPFEDDGFRS